MQKFITEQQTMTVNKQKNPAINAGFHIQTMSDYPIKTIFRKRNTAEKEIFPYVFFHAKRKVREKTATFLGKHRQLLEKDRQLSDQTPLCI